MKTKIALFAAVLGVTGIIAGTTAFAQHAPQANNGRSNIYVINQCKNGGWRELGYKNQGLCIADMVGNNNGGHGGQPDTAGFNQAIREAIDNLLASIFGSVFNGR